MCIQHVLIIDLSYILLKVFVSRSCINRLITNLITNDANIYHTPNFVRKGKKKEYQLLRYKYILIRNDLNASKSKENI